MPLAAHLPFLPILKANKKIQNGPPNNKNHRLQEGFGHHLSFQHY